METNLSPENKDLQFEKADFDQAPPAKITCVVCKKEIPAGYFEINKKTVCPACKENLAKALAAGSPVKRFTKAFLAGSGAALLGAGIYYAIEAATGYEFGLIAVLVGFMVGRAVRWGSKNKGGWAYQALAMFLTYNAVVLTYLPFVLKDFKDKMAERNSAVTMTAPATEATPVSPSSTPGAPETPVPTLSAPLSVGAAAPLTPSAAETPSAPLSLSTPSNPVTGEAPNASNPKKPVTLMTFLIAIGGLLILAYLIPFLAGLKNIIGLVIIGFAVYEAWRINKKPRFDIRGPFQQGPPKI
jgi:hypothetical protein